MMYQKELGMPIHSIFHSGILQIYLVGDSVRVSFKWVVLISTKQEFAYTQSAKVSICYVHTLALVSKNRQRPYIIETMHSYILPM